MENEFWSDYAIPSPPVYTLSACYPLCDDSCGEADLADFSAWTEELQLRLRSFLSLCSQEQLDFLAEAATLSAGHQPIASLEDNHLFLFLDNELLFLFYHEENFYLAFPQELAQIYSDMLAEEDFSAANAHKREICHYAMALLELYGMYPISRLTQVWNHHHREKIDEEEARAVLSDLEEFSNDFYLDNAFVVHDCLDDDDADLLQDTVCDLDYYMPTKSVIALYAGPDFDYYEQTPGANQFSTFLADFIADEVALSNIQLDCSICCQRMQDLSYLRGMLADAGFPLEDEATVAAFHRHYQLLQDNTHVWELGGFTPVQFTALTGKSVPRKFLPKTKPKKVGKKNK